MEEPNKTANSVKQKALGGAKTIVRKITNFIKRILRPILIKGGIFAGIIILIACFVWGLEENLFKTASSSSSIFNKPGTTYVDEETGEEIPLIQINQAGTMWIIPRKAVEYVRDKIMETTDVVQFNLTEEVPHIRNEESNTEEINRYIREFLKAEQVVYYPNLEY